MCNFFEIRILPQTIENMRFLIFVFLGICCTSTIYTQDIHFTQPHLAPVWANPGEAGLFLGSARVSGIYRGQWGGGTVTKSINTPTFTVDAPLIRGLRKKDWIGVGGTIIQDKRGLAAIKSTAFLISAAYHISLDKKQKRILSIGAQGGRMSWTDDLTDPALRFEEELNGTTPTGQSTERDIKGKSDFFDLNAGAVFTTALNKTMTLKAGLSLSHLLKSKYNLLQGGTDVSEKLPTRINFYSRMGIGLGKVWSMHPSVYIYDMNVGSAPAVAITDLLGYKFNTETTLYGGLGYRMGDALTLQLGADYKDIKLGLAWDANTSGHTKSIHQAFELGATYIMKFKKKPKADPAIICPRF